MKVATPETFDARLLDVRPEAAGMTLLRFSTPAQFFFSPGQFIQLSLNDDPAGWRSYSLCSAPSQAHHYVEVLVPAAGELARSLHRALPGVASVHARGPYGRWVYDNSTTHAVLVSGGAGIAPFRAMCEHARETGIGKITLCHSAQTPERLIFSNDYRPWRDSGISVIARISRAAASSPPWTGPLGRWTPEDILAACGHDPAAVFYFCGPGAMTRELSAGLRLLRIDEARLRTEKWGDPRFV